MYFVGLVETTMNYFSGVSEVLNEFIIAKLCFGTANWNRSVVFVYNKIPNMRSLIYKNLSAKIVIRPICFAKYAILYMAV